MTIRILLPLLLLAGTPATPRPGANECDDLGVITVGPPSGCVEATFLVLPPYADIGLPDWAFAPPHSLDPKTVDPGLMDPDHCVIDILYSYGLSACSPVDLLESSPSIKGAVLAVKGMDTFDSRETGFRIPSPQDGSGFFELSLANDTTVLRWDYPGN